MTTATISRRAVLFGAAGLGVAAVAGISATNLPRSFAADIRIHTTAEWGAKAPDWQSGTITGSPKKIVVHHMASKNVSDTSLDAAYSIAKWCQDLHMGQGWGDSGQHFSISRGGHIMEARHGSLAAAQDGSYYVEGIHAAGANKDTIGIENEGTYTDELPPQELWDSLVELIAYLCTQYGLDATAIVGHRDCTATACPGDQLYGQLDQLRSEVDQALGGDGNVPAPEPEAEWPTLRNGSEGDAVKTAQRLLRHREVEVEADGKFGPATEKAIVDFQKGQDLTADGVVGPQTWDKLIEVLRSGSSGEAVIALQEMLNANGVEVDVDGSFGPKTEEAVRSFQEEQHFVTDMVVGPITWRGLLGS